jgi:hypothetical protein
MDKRDLQTSADKLNDKIKKMPSTMVAMVRPAPRRRTGPIWFLAGLAGGAATLYFFDSRMGASRRRMLLDRMVEGRNDVMEMTGKKARSLRDQAKGKIDRDPDVAIDLAGTGTQS